jgi:hypothetical protein
LDLSWLQTWVSHSVDVTDTCLKGPSAIHGSQTESEAIYSNSSQTKTEEKPFFLYAR